MRILYWRTVPESMHGELEEIEKECRQIEPWFSGENLQEQIAVLTIWTAKQVAKMRPVVCTEHDDCKTSLDMSKACAATKAG